MQEEFRTLVKELQLNEYDIILVSDGSGTQAQFSSGWACFVWDRKENTLFTFYGGASHGTNNYAELAPVLQALWFINNTYKDKPLKIACVTDSEWMAKSANGIYARATNLGLWASIDYYKSIYQIKFYHVYRNTNPISKACDKNAGKLRILMNEYEDNL